MKSISVVSDLGNLISEHKENEKATGSTLFVGLLCFGLTVGMVFLFLGEREISFNKILFGLCAVFAVIGGVGCVQSYLKNRAGRAELYEHGLIAEKGGRRHVARWDEIAVVKESIEQMYLKGVYVYDRYLYTIETRAGETFVLSNMLSDIDEIGRVVKRKTLERLFPQAVEKIEGGGQVTFDSLRADKNGLSGVHWTELANFAVENDVLEIKDRSGKTIVKGFYSATPNGHLLLALLKKYSPHIASA